MPRQTQEEREKFFVGEYLQYKGFTTHAACQIQSLSEFCPDHRKIGITGPDVKVTLTAGHHTEVIAFEVTECQSDQRPSGSGRRTMHNIWNSLRDCLDKRLAAIPDRRISQVNVCVELDPGRLPTKRECPDLADKMVQFIVANLPQLIASADRSIVYRVVKRNRQSDSQGYPLIARYVLLIRAVYKPNLRGLSWQSIDASCGGISPCVLAKCIERKSSRRPTYNVGSGETLYLLLCATGETSTDRSPGDPGVAKQLLRTEKVQNAAKRSGFDKVIFWERAGRWDVELW